MSDASTAAEPRDAQSCAILYADPPALDAALTSALLAALHAAAIPTASVEPPPAASTTSGARLSRALVTIGPHRIELVAVAEPAADPPTQLALREALLTADDRARLLANAGYIHCRYLSGSATPLDQLRALYRLVATLIRICAPPASPALPTALGVVDVPALHAFAAPHLLDLTRWLDADPPPVSLWARVVAIGDRRGVMWLLTRGLTHFHLPELALRGQDIPDPESGEALLMSVALWLIQGITHLQPGDTIDMFAAEGAAPIATRWRAHRPSPDDAWLNAPFGAIVLTPAR